MKVNAAGLAAVLVLGAVLGVAGARWVAGTGKPVPAAGAPGPAKGASGPAKGAPVAVGVEVAAVESIMLPRGIAAVGTLRSENSVTLRPEITGRISEINFKEGGKVARGQVLVRLDDSVVKAQLQQAQANLSLAISQNRRAQELSNQGFISKQARDEAASQLKIQQAAVALASAQLGKTAISAPFDGLIGLRQVSVGDYVSPGADLVQIESIDPLQVDFRVPEHYLAKVRVGQPLTLSLDAMPGLSREGRVGAINPLVDVGGRSILLRAEVPNSDGLLRPGMFSRVQLQLADDKTLMVPEAALVPSEEARYVYRIAGDRVERREVHIGLRRSGKVEVLDGLAEGDRVVVAGLQKISDGALVRVVPGADAKPAPAANGS